MMNSRHRTCHVPQTAGEQLAGYESYVRASGSTKETVRVRVSMLNRIANTFDPVPLLQLTTEQLTRYMGQPGWMPETRKSVRAAIASFYRYAVDMDLIVIDPSRKLPVVHVPAGRPKPTPDSVYAAALLGANDRGTLLLMLAAFTGLRRTEIAQAHTDHIECDVLRVVGKGGKTRLVPLHPLLAARLAMVPSGFLFPGKEDGHLSPGHVGVLFKRMLGSGWSAHSLRHRFATRAYAADRDLLAVQQLLGHSKPETTQRYTAIPNGALAAAVLAVG
jgi:integrase/recombinase XerC